MRFKSFALFLLATAAPATAQNPSACGIANSSVWAPGAGALGTSNECRITLRPGHHPPRSRTALPGQLVGFSLQRMFHVLFMQVYGADGVTFTPAARKALDRIEAEGHGHLPVCMAKTQSSFSTDPTHRGAPTGHTVDVREVRLAAGAGFVVMVTGTMLTMPGLPKVPAASHIDVDDDGRITGLS